MDFSMFPPEINSALMYSGPGVGPLLEASASWNGLAESLTSSAGEYSSTLGSLRGVWLGPSAEAAQISATRFLSWMSETAEMALVSAGQAAAAAVAYETAFAATVPPPVVAANRALLMMLVATNFLGVNTAAIAAAEAEYAEMWAQDAAAMYAYQGESVSAIAGLPQFGPAPQVATGAQPVGVTQAAASAPQSIWSWLTSPNSFLTALGDATTPVGFVESQWLSFSSSGPWQAPLLMLTYGLMGQANGFMDRSNSLTEEGNRISRELALDDEMQQLGRVPGGAVYPVNPAEAPTMPENSPRASFMHPGASMGAAHTAGHLSVPPSWRSVDLAAKAAPLSGGGMVPTPIAAVGGRERGKRKGEEILQVKLILPKGV